MWLLTWLPRFLACRCDTKDQSIHLFAMPRAWDPYATAEESAARMAAEEAAEEAAAAREL